MALVGCALRAGYGGCAVLDGVDFRLEPGQLLCLLGPNGAGKSTLARALCGLLPVAASAGGAGGSRGAASAGGAGGSRGAASAGGAGGSRGAASAGGTEGVNLSSQNPANAPRPTGPAIRPSSVEVDGDSLSRLSPRARAQRIGFLPQEIEPSFSFRVSEAVELGARVAANQAIDPAKHPRASAKSRQQAAVSAALRAVDAEHLADRRLDALSGGERRRVLLASVLAQQPKYLVLDEPTAMLDLEHQVQLFEVLRTRCEAGMGVVVVTHDLNLAAQWADELVLLHQGRIAAQGTPKQVFVRDTLSGVFGSRFQLLETPEGRPVLVPR